MSEKTLTEHVAPCGHCWHDTGILRLSNPPQMEEVCCWCGDKKLRAIGYVSGLTVTHGRVLPHHSNNRRRFAHLLTLLDFSKVLRPPMPSMPVMTTHSRSMFRSGGSGQPCAVPYQTSAGCKIVE